MKFKTGLILGLGVGYVLGAKAGRERYDQIMATVGKLAGTEPAQNIAEKSKALADLGAERARQVVGEGMTAVSEKIREKAG